MSMITVAIYLVIQMIFVWIIAMRLKNPSIVDVAWAVGIMISAGIYLFFTKLTERNVLIFILAFIWSIRLSGYIYATRVAKGHIDKRYLTLSKKWKVHQSIGYFFNFQLQALFSWIIAMVFYFPGQSITLPISTSDIISSLVVIIGVIGESIADQQLLAFQKFQSGKVCNIGLWEHSRHPNYFFEWLVWCGFSAFALRSEYGYFALLSPITLYIILNHITGPMTEKGSLESRGNIYRAYIESTPMFWPRIKVKKNN